MLGNSDDKEKCMKVFVSLLLIVMLVTGYSLAGCGKKENDEGTLTAVNSGSKTFVVTDSNGNKTTFKLTPGTKVKDQKGNAAQLSDLVDQRVAVVSEHSQADRVSQL